MSPYELANRDAVHAIAGCIWLHFIKLDLRACRVLGLVESAEQAQQHPSLHTPHCRRMHALHAFTTGRTAALRTGMPGGCGRGGRDFPWYTICCRGRLDDREYSELFKTSGLADCTLLVARVELQRLHHGAA